MRKLAVERITTEGQRQLAALEVPDTYIANRSPVTTTQIARVRRFGAAPDEPTKRALAKWFNIDCEAWDAPPVLE
ncbi:MAG: hypothetical protein QM756_12360 [Polyangiaceae bacterium]